MNTIIKIFLAVTIVLMPLILYSQCEQFDALISEGDSFLKGKKPNYQEGINSYFAAILACTKRANEAQQKIKKIVDDINETKRQISIKANEIKEQRDKIEEEKNKLSLILSFVQENNILQGNWHNDYVQSGLNTINLLDDLMKSRDSIPIILKDSFMTKVFLSNNFIKSVEYLLEIGQRDTVINLCNKLLSVDSFNIRASELKIVALLRLDSIASNNRLALAEIYRLKKIVTNNHTVIINEGLTLCRLGKYREAKISFLESENNYFPFGDVSTDQVSQDIFRVFGIRNMIVKSTDFDDFLSLYKNLIDYITGEKSTPSPSNSVDAKVDIILYAILQLHRQLNAQPRDFGAYLALAELWQSIGFSDLSEFYVSKFIHNQTTRPDSRYLNYNKQFLEQLKIKKNIVIASTNLSLIHFVNAKKLYQNDNKKAIIAIENALKEEPDNLEYLYWAGIIYQSDRDSAMIEKAINCFNDCIEKKPYNSNLYSQRAYAKYNLFTTLKSEENRKKIAVSSLDDIIAAQKLNPYDRDMLWFKYWIYRFKDDESLLDIFKKLLHSDSTNMNLWKKLVKSSGLSDEVIKQSLIRFNVNK